jgi:hypothetical protein
MIPSALKLASWLVGIAGATLFAFVESGTASTVQIVVIAVTIAAVPPTVTGIFGLILQTRANKKLNEVSVHVNGMMAEAHRNEKAATARADKAEAFTAGSDFEREKEK